MVFCLQTSAVILTAYVLSRRGEVLAEISETPELLARYQEWNPEQQDRFLDYCTGQRGVKILYDAFFKAILDPEAKPERVEALLFLLLNRKIRILHVHPLESPRMGDLKRTGPLRQPGGNPSIEGHAEGNDEPVKENPA